jgi:hypothetical protein
VVGITLEDSAIGALCRFKLFLLFVHMSDLEPDVFLSEWAGRVRDNVLETVQTLVELLLLFVNYAKAEVNLVGLFKCRLHAHNLRESLFGVLEGSVAIIEYSDAVPKLRLLWVRQMIQSLLVGRVCLL